jgi:hypothetical protein
MLLISPTTSKNERRKRMINAQIPLEFLLEWFLKYLFPYISKDVNLSKVRTKEEAIFKSQN